MNKVLPQSLTSYDLLKALAVILMVIDHVGHHFYPDEMWFRVLGRLCVPIWFFLIGYANTTQIPKLLWGGALVVAASGIIAGQFLLPLNILFTIILFRLSRRGVLVRSLHSPEALRGMFLILLFFTLPSAIIFEYGSMGMMFVMMGYVARHRDVIYERIERQYVLMFIFAAFLSFCVVQGLSLPSVSNIQAVVMFLGFGCVGWMLWRFSPVEYKDANNFMAPSVIRIIQFAGRRTLEIYVVHVVIFRAACMYLYPEDYGFMEWGYVPLAMVAPFI